MKEGHVDDLRSHIAPNIHYYKQEGQWLNNFFKEGAWQLTSKIPFDGVELLIPQSPEEYRINDIENTKIIYTALKGLSLTQASDERLWASLCHFYFWEYMRARWPIERWLEKTKESKRINELIRERYFLLSNRSRGLIRNGIARLWWFGYASYDKTREDPFELTEILLKTLDVAESLLGRAFSHNCDICIYTLVGLKKLIDEGKSFPKRDDFRELMKYVNQIGGVTVLDAIDSDDFQNILKAKLEKLCAEAT